METESFRTGPPSTPVVQRSTFNSPSLSVPHRLLPADRGRPWPPTHARPAPHVTRIDFLIGNTTMHHGRTMGGGGGGESGTGTDTKARARHTLDSLPPPPATDHTAPLYPSNAHTQIYIYIYIFARLHTVMLRSVLGSERGGERERDGDGAGDSAREARRTKRARAREDEGGGEKENDASGLERVGGARGTGAQGSFGS